MIKDALNQTQLKPDNNFPLWTWHLDDPHSNSNSSVFFFEIVCLVRMLHLVRKSNKLAGVGSKIIIIMQAPHQTQASQTELNRKTQPPHYHNQYCQHGFSFCSSWLGCLRILWPPLLVAILVFC